MIDRWRWPRRRSRLPGRGRLAELATDPAAALRRAHPRRLARIGRIDDGTRLIGMLMIRDEDDIVAESVAGITRWFDRIYVLDGTTDPERVARTNAVLAAHPEIVWHGRDRDVFPDGVTDGARQVLLERIRADHGVDNWIGVLHADEFMDQDPRPMLAVRHPSTHPSLRVRVAHTFLHPDDAEGFVGPSTESVRRRVLHQMWPGVPEARFFFDDGSRDFDPALHSKVVPRSHRAGELVDGFVIVQYNERGPEAVVARARQRAASGWQLGHYRRLLDDPPAVFVPTLELPGAPFAPEFAGDPEGPFRPVGVRDVPGGPGGAFPAPVLVDAGDRAGVRACREEGRVERDLGVLTDPGGILDALHGGRHARRRAVALLDRPGVLGHGPGAGALPGRRALVRHTRAVVVGRRATPGQRARTVAEAVVRLANAGTGPAGWYAEVPGPHLAAVVELLEPVIDGY